MEHYWTVPTDDGGRAVGPSCLLQVQGSNLSAWNEKLIFGSLAYRRLLKYDRQSDETVSLNLEGRIRTIKQLPDGDIIALVERSSVGATDGKVILISN